MSIWFFIVLVIGIVYALNRLTSTTDLPVSTRLAEARELVERSRQPIDVPGRSQRITKGKPCVNDHLANVASHHPA